MEAKGNEYQGERIWYLDYGDVRFQSFAIALNAKGSLFSISPVWPHGEKQYRDGYMGSWKFSLQAICRRNPKSGDDAAIRW
jgi:hypothetical protein